MEVCNKSVFRTSFGCGGLQESSFSFGNNSGLQIIYLTSLISKTSFYFRLLPSCGRIVTYKLQRQLLNFTRYQVLCLDLWEIKYLVLISKNLRYVLIEALKLLW